jgi:class 3 adenylate cyclase
VNDIALSTRDSHVLYTAGRHGVSLIKRAGKGWRKQADSGDIGQEFRSAVEEPDGRVWVTTRSSIVRIDFSANPPALDRFGEKEGVPAGWKNVYRIRGQVLFATEKGLMCFSAPDNRFAPDASLGPMFADGSHAVSILREDSGGNIWITGKGYHGVLERQANGGFEWRALPVLESGIDEIYAMHTDPGGTVWVSGAEGLLYRWQPSGINPDAGFRAVLRRVQVAGTGEALYAGAGELAKALRLPYRKNALRFEFVAPVYELEGRVEYQVRHDGSDDGWSSWSNETWRDYTNLFEHAYSFRVRARSPHGSVSEAAVFGFRIFPPWYRTWWAYLIYAVLAGGGIWLVTRWRTRQLQERNRWLEDVVDERTAEVRQQRDQIQAQERKTEALLLNILPAPVADELRTTGAVQPLSFDDVTVCFTDFVGFTASSEKVAAGHLVATLHEYFTAFDEIIERYGLEKMKTIGDAYMFASGLPRTRTAHAVDAVMAALEIVDAVDRLSRRPGSLHWGVRVGLNSGPVMAGVVGVRKFAYDIWGDTVNRAARMESSGEAGRVNLSARTWSLVGDFIECESRGLVRIKGGRELEMYFASGVKTELLGGPAFARLYQERFGETPQAIAHRQSAAGA